MSYPLSTIADLIFLRIHGLPSVIAIDKHVGENSFAKLDLWAVTCFDDSIGYRCRTVDSNF